MTQFKKENLHQHHLPMDDWNWSAQLRIQDKDGKNIWSFDAFELAELKKMLQKFDGRIGEWKD